MATYKVLQDIEAEDKLLGPLTLKQFIFAIITLLLGFLAYVFAQINIFLVIPWLLPISFFGFMAAPINKDQPNDVWLAARIRFLIKPRKRIWDQTGLQELVTITAPKKVEIQRTDGLSQGEVKSRLTALSSVMDTRGWAIKSGTETITSSLYQAADPGGTERLFNIEDSHYMPTLDVNIKPADDMLDIANNSIAQRIDETIKKQHSNKMEQLRSKIQEISSSELNNLQPKDTEGAAIDYSFITNNQSSEPGYANFGARVIQPGSASGVEYAQASSDTQGLNEQEVLDKIHKNEEIQQQIKSSSHEHRLNPIMSTNSTVKNNETTTNPSEPNVILKQLSQSNDISVSSIASLANHANQEKKLEDDETISLH